ncbi:hypothetical protein FXN63_08530 [Pigmentiphaga aceris]|uniref:AtuA-like ferredoxin-fold domain-containing protein n=1 Tax=Pigmentiphaga aceris TaxID=1940612 RepID=A0A5C0AVY6_9BURK|nr:hypothetical protein [Pigmentiphaga aceris]QEI05886.1 hypothetical protein FXN63_08530 [Pigmentiphaga aceris]
MNPSPNSFPLRALAHGRTGDKGNRSNISLIAFHPELYPVLEAQVTEAFVQQIFAGRHPQTVTRYLLPRMGAMNLVLDGVLDGGVNDALNLDAHGKSLVFLLLQASIDVPPALQSLLVHQKT